MIEKTSSLLQDVIDRAVEKQFNDFLIANNFDPDTMSEEEKNKHKATYITDLYAGTTLTPDSILNVLSSENPTDSVKAKIIDDHDSAPVCVDVTCEAPWIDIWALDGNKYCVEKFGKTTANNDLCDGIPGAQTFYFEAGDENNLENIFDHFKFLIKPGNSGQKCKVSD